MGTKASRDPRRASSSVMRSRTSTSRMASSVDRASNTPPLIAGSASTTDAVNSSRGISRWRWERRCAVGAGWPEASDTVLIVGHQPTLGIAAARLLSGADQAWSIKKGAVWWLRSRDREGGAPVVLHAVLGPDGL